MLVYVEWKIDLEKPNNINILRIREEKDPTIKYTIAKYKYRLADDIVLYDDLYQEQVFFTRIKIGNIKDNTIKILVYEEIKKIPNINVLPQKQLTIYMFGSPITMTSEIKAIHRANLFLDENNWPIISENIVDKELNKLVKEIKNNNIQNKISRMDNPYTLYLSEANIE